MDVDDTEPPMEGPGGEPQLYCKPIGVDADDASDGDGADASDADVVDDSAHIEARQARLGLGAKYLPHNAAVQDPLRRVLGKHAKVRGRARMSQP